MKISYVMPVYNCCGYLSDTIESILAQSHKDFELIIVDDGSTDDIEPLREYYQSNEKIEWIHNSCRCGAAYCRNLGNSKATGDFVAVCDAGDFYMPNRGESISKFFEENLDIDLVSSHVQVNDGMDHPVYVQESKEWDGKSKPPISHPTVAYRRKIVTVNGFSKVWVVYDIGSIDTDFYEFFLLNYFRKGFKLGIIDKILCVKRDLTSSDNSRDVLKAKKEKFEKYKEYGIEIEEANV